MKARRVIRLLLCLVIGGMVVSGCRNAEAVIDPDTVFGHRYDHRDPEERTTLDLRPPEPGEAYFTYPAVVHELLLRTGDPGADQRTPVELVMLGALPDGCTHLYAITEERLGRLIYVTFEMWRPRGGICAQVVRPYRFYYDLSEALPPGSYTLHLNDEARPFQILPPDAAEGR